MTTPPPTAADAVRVPASASPAFPVRRWSLTHLQGPFESTHTHDNWVALLEGAAHVKRYVDLAPQYGVTSVELAGRPGEGGIDLDWLVTYAAFERFRLRGAAADDVRRRQELIRTIQGWCDASGLELWVWHHEWYVPRGFYERYPEIRGVDYPVCLSHPMVGEVVAAKVHEFLDAAPGVAGLVLSMSECAGVELTSAATCRCPRCARTTVPERLRAMVEHVRRPLAKRGKRLVVRTFTHARHREVLRHTETEHMLRAFRGAWALPADVTLMTKYCPVDFYGEAYPDDALIGAFDNPHLVELTLNREILGGTWTPNLTPASLRRRVAHARAKGCVGLVGRVDSPTRSDDPFLTLDHPNAFNLYCFGRLAQDPDAPPDDLWDDYLSQRYPGADRAALRGVLEPTEAIGQKTYLTLGGYGISYAHRVPHVWHAEMCLEFFSLAKWRPDWLPTHERIQARDPSLLDEVLEEKDEAIALGEAALGGLAALRASLDPSDYLQLDWGLRRAGGAGRLWRALSEIFFVARALVAATTDDRERLLAASERLFAVTREIRAVHGRNAWPTVAGPYRGIGVEEFVVEAHRPLLYRLLGGEPPVAWAPKQDDVQPVRQLYPRGNAEHLWRVLLTLTPPDEGPDGATVTIDVAPPLTRLHAQEGRMTLTAQSGETLTLPLYWPLDEVELGRGEHRLTVAPPDWHGTRFGLRAAGPAAEKP